MRHKLLAVSTNQRDYRCPVSEKFKFHAADSALYSPQVQIVMLEDTYVRGTRVRDVVHAYAYATVDSYVYVFMLRVPVDLITTIGLTNLIDVHQLFGPRSKVV